MNPDRRKFLLDTGKLLVLSASASVAWEAIVAGKPETAPNYTMTDHWWGMVIDIDKCIGCGSCVRACKAENNVPLEPMYFRTWVEQYRVNPEDMDHPTVESPNGGYDGFPFKGAPDSDPKAKHFFVPKLCNHCADSPCTQVCPVGATFISPDGVVLIDPNYCVACRYCVQACPYGCRFIDPRTMTADKCTLCYQRITKGLTTACCENCPTGARQLGDLKNPNDPIQRFLLDHHVVVLKPQMATGAKVYYNDLDGSVR